MLCVSVHLLSTMYFSSYSCEIICYCKKLIFYDTSVFKYIIFSSWVNIQPEIYLCHTWFLPYTSHNLYHCILVIVPCHQIIHYYFTQITPKVPFLIPLFHIISIIFKFLFVSISCWYFCWCLDVLILITLALWESYVEFFILLFIYLFGWWGQEGLKEDSLQEDRILYLLFLCNLS